MKNTLKIIGIIVLFAVIGFSTTACASIGGGGEAITITITDIPAETFQGWEAYIALAADKAVAYAMPLPVDANTSSLTFTMLKQSNDRPFNDPKNYKVVFWFKKAGEKDADFVIVSRRINAGDNRISLNMFTRL